MATIKHLFVGQRRTTHEHENRETKNQAVQTALLEADKLIQQLFTDNK